MLICKNCKQEFTEKYCNHCGEKLLNDKDFNLSNILRQAIGSITDLDSKVFQTIKLLFFFPGRLTKNYINGIRVPYMRPFRIFIISNIFFFFFLSEVDVFRTPAHRFFVADYKGINVLEIVEQISLNKRLTQKEIAKIYDARATDLAKGLILLLIPFIALITMLIHYKKKIQFGKHVIFAIHYFSFLLLFSVFWSKMVELTNLRFNNLYFTIPITLVTLIYFTISLKVVYQSSWWLSILKGIFAVLLINSLIQLYSIGINLLTLNTI